MDLDLEILDGENAILRSDLEKSRQARNQLIRANRGLAARVADLESKVQALQGQREHRVTA